MNDQNQLIRPGIRFLVVALMSVTLVTPTVWADGRGVHSTGRYVRVNRGAAVAVHRDVDVNVHHSGVFHPVGGHFWGGVATGLAIGAVIHSAPPNPQTVVVQNTTYLVSEGMYYQPQGTGYVVVNPPVGVVVPAYPPGAVQTVVNDQVYYVANGLYYRPSMQNGVTVYTTVRL